MTPRPVTVRVPATSANLGPGFDSFGLALARYDVVTACRTDGGLLVEVAGVGAGEVPLTHEHLVVRAVRTAFDAAGRPMPGLRLSCVNCIPHGGGLGSSAAATVAGLLLGRELLVQTGGPRLSDDAVLALDLLDGGHGPDLRPLESTAVAVTSRDTTLTRRGGARSDDTARLRPPPLAAASRRARWWLAAPVSSTNCATPGSK